MRERDVGRLRQTSALNPHSDTLLLNRSLRKSWERERLAFFFFLMPVSSRVRFTVLWSTSINQHAFLCVPRWRSSGLRWPPLSGSLLGGCIPRSSPAFWATSREMSLRRVLGSLGPIFATKQKRRQVFPCAINTDCMQILRVTETEVNFKAHHWADVYARFSAT